MAAWAAGPVGWKVISLLQDGGSLCCPEKMWGSWHLGFALLAGAGRGAAGCPGQPEGLPQAAAGLERRVPAPCCSRPAWCQLLQRAGTTCFRVNSAPASRRPSKINLEISLPLALTECGLPFPSFLAALVLPPLSSLCPVSGLPATQACSSVPGSSPSQTLGLLPQFPPLLFHCLSFS